MRGSVLGACLEGENPGFAKNAKRATSVCPLRMQLLH